MVVARLVVGVVRGVVFLTVVGVVFFDGGARRRWSSWSSWPLSSRPTYDLAVESEPRELFACTRSRSSAAEVADGEAGVLVDGGVPAEHAAGHALVDHDLGALDADEVRAARVPAERGGRGADDEEQREQHEDRAAHRAPARALRPRRLAARARSGGSGGAMTAERFARRGRARSAWSGSATAPAGVDLEHVDDHDGDVVLAAGGVRGGDERVGQALRIGLGAGQRVRCRARAPSW